MNADGAKKGKWRKGLVSVLILFGAAGIVLWLYAGEYPAVEQDYGVKKYAGDSFTETGGEEEDVPLPVITFWENPSNADFYLWAGEDIYCIYANEIYIFVTQEGEPLTPDAYTAAYPFHEGLACVCKDGKYGYIDREGQVAIGFEYDRALPFVEGLAYFCKGDSYGFMDRTGTPLFYLDCDSVSSFREGLACVCVNGKYGYIETVREKPLSNRSMRMRVIFRMDLRRF